jgi:hypothetical protein
VFYLTWKKGVPLLSMKLDSARIRYLTNHSLSSAQGILFTEQSGLPVDNQTPQFGERWKENRRNKK